ncbi:hypothetical protein B0H10DRAFT_1937713 [Mycena sp. CBHHK59/15]|nr:hypothetical protein B0H10DRAFT_1937713 [Mycena sp. CBHHK59/15]
MSTVGDESPPEKKKPVQNQHLPTPPLELLKPLIEYYWQLGYTDEKVASECLDHFDHSVYGLSKSTIKRRRKSMGLLGTRQQAARWGDIEPVYQEFRKKNSPTWEHVGWKFLLDSFKVINPHGIQQRKRKRFRRKHFWAAGVMDILTFDQHDKWKRFGLWLHIGLDPYSGCITWLKIWWTNCNSKLITNYYFEACRSIGGIPLITQSDLGSENNGVANCHTMTRQRLDPSLKGTLQHRWMSKSGMNVKPEASWSQLRRNWTPGFENLLDQGPNANLYNSNNPLQRLVFRWLAIPWLQAELDIFVEHYNSTLRRADKHKILPHGIPDMIVSKPKQFGTTDYKLVPPAFDKQAKELYGAMQCPPVTYDNFWDLYVALLNEAVKCADDHFEGPAELMEEQAPLGYGPGTVRFLGYEYLGGLLNPPRMDPDDTREYADLTTSEEEEEED